MTRNTGKLSDPEWRRERASRAGRASRSLDAYIRALVDHAPELTAEQRDRLALLINPGGGAHAAR